MMVAANNVLAAQSEAAVITAPKGYDDALSALRALSAQHQKFETKQPIDLTQIEAEIASLQADVAQMKPAPAASTPSAK